MKDNVSSHHIKSEELMRRASAVDFWSAAPDKLKILRTYVMRLTGTNSEVLDQSVQVDKVDSMGKAAWDWTKRTISYYGIQYGEGYRNLGIWSVIIIVLAAVGYSFGLATTPDGQALGAPSQVQTIDGILRVSLDAILFSLATFVSPGFTDFAPNGVWGRSIATTEAAIGTAVFALFIYIVGRQAGR
jgi:hypothetical protein